MFISLPFDATGNVPPIYWRCDAKHLAEQAQLISNCLRYSLAHHLNTVWLYQAEMEICVFYFKMAAKLKDIGI